MLPFTKVLCVYFYTKENYIQSDIFSSSIKLKKIIFNSSEGFDNLPLKTYNMMKHFVNQKECDACLKIDDDARFCVDRFSNYIRNVNLSFVYAGLLTKYPTVEYEKRDPRSLKYRLSRRLKNKHKLHHFRFTSYMQGSAYVLGKSVAQFILKHKYSELLNSGWEDVNIGLYSNSMKNRIVISLPGVMLGEEECNRPNLVVYHKCKSFSF